MFRNKTAAKLITNITNSDTTLTVDDINFVNLLSTAQVITITNGMNVENVKVISNNNNQISIQRVEQAKSFPAGSIVHSHISNSKIFKYTFNSKNTVNPNTEIEIIDLTNITPLYRFSISGILEKINLNVPLEVRIYITSSSYITYTSTTNKIFFLSNFSSTSNATTLSIRVSNNNTISPCTFTISGILTGFYI